MVVIGMKRSTLSIFLAGAAALSSQVAVPAALADTNTDQMVGGLQEWDTSQPLEAEAKKDADAKKAAEKAAEEDICVPIGEGENCW